MSDEQLNELCEEWQKRLRLQDWSVQARLVRYHELGDGVGGHCEFSLQRRAARISIKCPGDEESIDGDHSLDTEGYLVHELLHLHFIHYCPSGVENDVFEQGLNAMAAAFVKLKREAFEPAPEPLCVYCGKPAEDGWCIISKHQSDPLTEETFHAECWQNSSTRWKLDAVYPPPEPESPHEERRQHLEEQQVGAPPLPICEACGKPIANIFEQIGTFTGHLETLKRVVYHKACYPE